MDKSNKTGGLFQRMRSRPAPTAADAADLGTCIGLEYSLCEAAEAPGPAPEAARRPGWIERFTNRGKAPL